MEIGELDLTVRTADCLEMLGISTVEELCAWSRKELLRAPNLGKKALVEIADACHRHGVALRGDDVPTPEVVQKALENLPEMMRLAEEREATKKAAEEAAHLKKKAEIAERKKRVSHAKHGFRVSADMDLYHIFGDSFDPYFLYTMEEIHACIRLTLPKGERWVSYDPKSPEYLTWEKEGVAGRGIEEIHLGYQYDADPIGFLEQNAIEILEIREGAV